MAYSINYAGCFKKDYKRLKNGIFQLKNWKKHYVFCLKQEPYQIHTIPTNYRVDMPANGSAISADVTATG